MLEWLREFVVKRGRAPCGPTRSLDRGLDRVDSHRVQPARRDAGRKARLTFRPELLILEDRTLFNITPLSVQSPTVLEHLPVSANDLAVFQFTTGASSDYTATITWGDGNTSAGNVTNPASDQ